ncbi:MAG: NAD-dependent epimerase/dehydratase family protein [Propionibacterium sp.]|nr:NAD-dependent epimerase/dehydratase family protein [Propionibacterium sp.]
MRIVITGGQGFIGSALAAELLRRGTFRGRPIERIVLADRIAPVAGRRDDTGVIGTISGDLAESMPQIFASPVDAVFHLAAAVSAECERDFDLGMTANLDITRRLLETARSQSERGGGPVSVVFSSSVAVYGPDAALPLPEVVSETTIPTPQSSYGAQKLACETLIADYTRKGYVDGRVVRLMTVAVRPGRPNAAASSFVSGIIREPLAGLDTSCPVGRDVRLAIASPRTTVRGILTVAEAERGDQPGQLRGRLPVNLPALTVSVGEMLDALRSVAGPDVAARVHESLDPAIEVLVRSWPATFENSRAHDLGLRADPDIVTVIREYLEDHPDAVAGPSRD